MTPRDNMRRAIEFRGPERLPISGYGDADDRVSIGTEPIKPPAAVSDPMVDEWLCRWERTDTPNMGQVKAIPWLIWPTSSPSRGRTAMIRGAM